MHPNIALHTHWASLFPHYHGRKCCAGSVGCISVAHIIIIIVKVISFMLFASLNHLMTLVCVSFLFFKEFLLFENLCLITNTLS